MHNLSYGNEGEREYNLSWLYSLGFTCKTMNVQIKLISISERLGTWTRFETEAKGTQKWLNGCQWGVKDVSFFSSPTHYNHVWTMLYTWRLWLRWIFRLSCVVWLYRHSCCFIFFSLKWMISDFCWTKWMSASGTRPSLSQSSENPQQEDSKWDDFFFTALLLYIMYFIFATLLYNDMSLQRFCVLRFYYRWFNGPQSVNAYYQREKNEIRKKESLNFSSPLSLIREL